MVGEIEILEPITAKTIVDAIATSATVSWRYKKHVCDSTSCRTWYVYSTISREIPLTPNQDCKNENLVNGSVTWKDKELKYEITQKPRECLECNCNNLLIVI